MRPSGVCASIFLRKSLADDAGGVYAFGFDHAGIDGVDADLLRAQVPWPATRVIGVDGALGGAVDRRRSASAERADHGTDVDDAAAVGVEVLDGFLRGQQQAEHVEVELLVEVLGGDRLRAARIRRCRRC